MMRDFFETLETTNVQAASYVGMAVPYRDVKTIINDDRLIQNMVDKGRNKQYKNIQDHISQIENDQVNLTPFEAKAGKLIRNIAKSIFNWNIKLAGKQQLSEVLLAPYVARRHLKGFTSIPTVDELQAIFEVSPENRLRFEHGKIDRDLGNEGDIAYTYFTGKEAKAKAGFKLMKFHDRNAIAFTFRVAKSEVLEHLGSENHPQFKEMWRDRAEWLIRHTQPTWHTKDRSLIGSSKNPLSRAFTMFTSQTEKIVQMGNNAVNEYRYADKATVDKKQAAERQFAKTIGTVVLNAALVAAYDLAWASLLAAKSPELKDYLNNMIKNTIGLAFFTRPIARAISAAINRLDGDGYKQVDVEVPLTSFFEDALDGGVNLTTGTVKLLRNEPGWEDDLQKGTLNSIEAILTGSGLPYYGPKSLLVGAKNWTEASEGYVDPLTQ